MSTVDLTHFLSRATTEDPYFRFLRFQVERPTPGNVVLKVHIDPDFHTNRRGITHGSPLAALCDACMGWSCRTLGYHVVTVNMDISYIRPVMENTWVYGEGRVVHHGSKTIVCEAHLYDEAHRLAIVGKGTYWIHHTIDLATDV